MVFADDDDDDEEEEEEEEEEGLFLVAVEGAVAGTEGDGNLAESPLLKEKFSAPGSDIAETSESRGRPTFLDVVRTVVKTGG